MYVYMQGKSYNKYLLPKHPITLAFNHDYVKAEAGFRTKLFIISWFIWPLNFIYLHWYLINLFFQLKNNYLFLKNLVIFVYDQLVSIKQALIIMRTNPVPFSLTRKTYLFPILSGLLKLTRLNVALWLCQSYVLANTGLISWLVKMDSEILKVYEETFESFLQEILNNERGNVPDQILPRLELLIRHTVRPQMEMRLVEYKPLFYLTFYYKNLNSFID